MIPRKELLVEFRTGAVHLAEVETDSSGRPVPRRCATVPRPEGQNADDLGRAIAGTLVGAGIRTRLATVVLGRQELLVRPAEVPAAIAERPTGYAASAIARIVPAEGLGEIMAACLPTGQPRAGMVPCLLVGARWGALEPIAAVLEAAGLGMARILPATAGALMALRIADGEAVNAIGVRVDPDGVEIIGMLPGTNPYSVWISAPGDGLDGPDLRLAGMVKSEIGALTAGEAGAAIPIRVFGSRSLDVIPALQAAMPAMAIKPLVPWYSEQVPHYEPARGIALATVGPAYLPLAAAALSPPAAEMRTQSMQAQRDAARARRRRARLGLAVLCVLAFSLAAWWLAGARARAEVRKLDARYRAVAARAQALAAAEAETRGVQDRLIDWWEALNASPDWCAVIEGIQDSLVAGITIASFNLDGVRDSVVSGAAADEQSVAAFVRGLAAVPSLAKVSVSYIRSIPGGHGVEFAVTFTAAGGGGRP